MKPESDSELALWVDYFQENLALSNHTFSHGAAHGLIIGLMFIFLIILNNALFERRGWYIP